MRGKQTPLSDMIDAFMFAKEAQGRSPKTLEEYRYYLRAFDTLQGGLRLEDLTPDRINRYVANYRRRSQAGGRLAAAYLKSLASWLSDSGYWSTPLGGSVLASVKAPRFRKEREGYTREEADLILRTLDTWTHRTALRDKAVVITFMATGCRLNEIRELRLRDVHIERPLERSWIFIRGETSKGRQSRKIRLDPKAAGAIEMYRLDERPQADGDAPLFLGEEGQHFTLNSFQTYTGRLRDRFKAAGVSNWTAHRNRHWWATESHAAGMTIFDIQAEGGWKDVNMVRRYTKNRPFEELQQMPTALSSVIRALPSNRVRNMRGQMTKRRVS